MFRLLSSRAWRADLVLDSTDPEHSRCCRKLCWKVLLRSHSTYFNCFYPMIGLVIHLFHKPLLNASLTWCCARARWRSPASCPHGRACLPVGNRDTRCVKWMWACQRRRSPGAVNMRKERTEGKLRARLWGRASGCGLGWAREGGWRRHPSGLQPLGVKEHGTA